MNRKYKSVYTVQIEVSVDLSEVKDETIKNLIDQFEPDSDEDLAELVARTKIGNLLESDDFTVSSIEPEYTEQI